MSLLRSVGATRNGGSVAVPGKSYNAAAMEQKYMEVGKDED